MSKFRQFADNLDSPAVDMAELHRLLRQRQDSRDSPMNAATALTRSAATDFADSLVNGRISIEEIRKLLPLREHEVHER